MLTGETGAGKSILLDALGLALGARADAALVRQGAGQASVTAAFELADDHPAARARRSRGSRARSNLLLRRMLAADGRSRAFVNDQPVSVGLLRQLGDSLVEILGQFEQHGLIDPATHRAALDAFGGNAAVLERVAAARRAWRTALRPMRPPRPSASRAQRRRRIPATCAAELEALGPQARRGGSPRRGARLLMHREQVVEALNAALALLSGEPEDGGDGLEAALGRARRRLERAAEKAAGRLDPALAALDRAALELGEVLAR